MEPADIVSNAIAILALIVSLVTAYKTLFARFNGNAWASNRFVLTKLDTIPSLGVACFCENLGARAGALDDLRLKVHHNETKSTFEFYPQLMRNDYSIYKSYKDADWFPFSRILLPPRQRMEKYVLFKPLNDQFTAQPGTYHVTLEARWDDGLGLEPSDGWNDSDPAQTFTVSDQSAGNWANEAGLVWQVHSNELLAQRNT